MTAYINAEEWDKAFAEDAAKPHHAKRFPSAEEAAFLATAMQKIEEGSSTPHASFVLGKRVGALRCCLNTWYTWIKEASDE